MGHFSCEINSPQMHDLVYAAASKLLPDNYHLRAIFQNGQWHIYDSDTGALWSVYDGRGSGTMYGFGLELQERGKD